MFQLDGVPIAAKEEPAEVEGEGKPRAKRAKKAVKKAAKYVVHTLKELGIDPMPEWMQPMEAAGRDYMKYRTFGQSMVAAAATMNVPILEFVAMLAGRHLSFPYIHTRDEQGNPKFIQLTWVPGHPHLGPLGPRRSRIMVLSKWPGREEAERGRTFCGESGKVWKDELDRLGIAYDDWYITNVCKFRPPPGVDTLPVAYLRECMPVLYYELSIVRPEIIICMGADAVQAILGESAKITALNGTISEFSAFPDWRAKVLVTEHPVNVLKESRSHHLFYEQMKFVGHVLKTGGTRDEAIEQRKNIRHREVISDFNRLDSWVAERVEANDLRLVVDCEWAGAYPDGNPATNYLRSIQFSWAPGCAVYLKLTDCQGRQFLSSRGKYVLGQHLRPLFTRPGVRLGGHNIRADLPWLFDLGLRCPEVEAAVENGHDTMLCQHVLNQASTLGLEALVLQYCPELGRYDEPVRRWLDDNPRHKSEGFRWVPDELLEPYGMDDVDGPFRIWDAQEEQLARVHAECLTRPHYTMEDGTPATPASLFYKVVMGATLGILDMELTGIRVDVDRLQKLTHSYSMTLTKMSDELRQRLNWPEFNFRSTDHCRGILFPNAVYKGKKMGVVPPGAKCFDFQPIKTTGKGHGTPWDRVVSRGQQHLHAPSTDGDVLAILAQSCDDPTLKLMRDIRFVDQICKNFLRGEEEDEQGNMAYLSGLLACTRGNSRIYTRLKQTMDTGRYSSSDPNLQNIPSKQEKPLQKLLKQYGAPHIFSIRSCFTASPGMVLVSADYKSAELVVMACHSQDRTMMDIVLNPKRDLHLETCNNIFGLGLSGLENLVEDELERLKDKYKADRIKAKAVNFGIPYGLGASGLLSDLETEGVDSSLQECQEILDKHAKMFHDLHRFLEYCASHVDTPPYYFQSVWGRRRHFFRTSDEQVLAAQKREAKNFPIQECVAECLSIAIKRLYDFKRQTAGALFWPLLPVHDALLFEVQPKYLETFVCDVLPTYMPVLIPGLNVKLDIDVEVGLRWSEKPTRQEMLDVGLTPEQIDNYVSTSDGK